MINIQTMIEIFSKTGIILQEVPNSFRHFILKKTTTKNKQQIKNI
jgi:hypothetical protein